MKRKSVVLLHLWGGGQGSLSYENRRVILQSGSVWGPQFECHC